MSTVTGCTKFASEEPKRIAHCPDTHPEEWKGGIYMGNDGYTMHLDAGGVFDDYYEAEKAKAAAQKLDFAENKLKSYAEWQAIPSEQLVYWPENSETPYSKADFVRLCKGSDEVAYDLYAVCEWLCPETVLDEDSFANDGDKCFPTCH